MISDFLRRLTGRRQTTKPSAADLEAADREAAQQRLRDLADQQRGRPDRTGRR